MVQALRERWGFRPTHVAVLPKRRAGCKAVRPLHLTPLERLSTSAGDTGMDTSEPAGKQKEEEASAEEAAVVPVLPAPEQPTTQMVEAHRASGHLPFRSWCSSCVRGRGRSLAHRKQQKDQEVIPTISVDFGFFGSEENPNKDNPVLVIKDRKSRA